ncbi:MAG: lysine--tRNA ligase [Hyperthermus sp.]|nr:MAG: lysine--tRNA ligase [Hyperthermus sp.]
MAKARDLRREKFLREAVVECPGRGLCHWIDALAEHVYQRLRERGKCSNVVFNGGLSVSGLQHIGRLRGEVIINDVVASILEAKGCKVKRILTLYTQDAWKGKREQLNQFANVDEASKYKGWPLIRIPDPLGAVSNWVERYWSDFGPYLNMFTRGRVEVVTTSELYQGKLLEFTKRAIKVREKVREIINKYRGRQPYPDTWIPFEPVCGSCGRIDTTMTLKVDLEKNKVQYMCRNCGHIGETKLSNGKLNWRLEWVGVWWALNVSFEPYGKDHAAPGGSRDSAAELAINVFGIEPPEGMPYEWVALKLSDGRQRDMSSSGFIGFTPRDWLEVATPELLRFLFLRTPPMKKIALSLHEIPQYYNLYYKAERIYYGIEKAGDEHEKILLSRSYELSYVQGSPPPTPPAQPPYTHLAILSQVLPREKWGDEGLRRLQQSGHLPEKPSMHDVKRILGLMPKARVWAQKYAPEHMKVTILREVPEELTKRIPEAYRELIVQLGQKLGRLDQWSEDSIKKAMIEFTASWENSKRKTFYKYIYMILVGRENGPRAAPLLSLLPRNFVIQRFLSLK